MSRDVLKDRESAFEYEFCHKVDQQLMERLREKLAAEERREALSRATGVKDEAVLQELDSLGIRSECALALSLFPLVHVAWANGNVDEAEREAVLGAVETIGHERECPSSHLLETWLGSPPAEALFNAWKHYVSALVLNITPPARRAVKYSVLTRSRRVAEAAGGVLGIHKVSAAENAALQELEAVFNAAAEHAAEVFPAEH